MTQTFDLLNEIVVQLTTIEAFRRVHFLCLHLLRFLLLIVSFSKLSIMLCFTCLQVYPTELEKVPEFKGFSDFCHTFNLVRGKNIEDEESNQIGEFKVCNLLYK